MINLKHKDRRVEMSEESGQKSTSSNRKASRSRRRTTRSPSTTLSKFGNSRPKASQTVDIYQTSSLTGRSFQSIPSIREVASKHSPKEEAKPDQRDNRQRQTKEVSVRMPHANAKDPAVQPIAEDDSAET